MKSTRETVTGFSSPAIRDERKKFVMDARPGVEFVEIEMEVSNRFDFDVEGI